MAPAKLTKAAQSGDIVRTVAVVGGGLAGLAAACALAESGFRVTLFERRPYLGGRASSYQHPATGEIVDNCQHVLFGLCTNLLAFYRTIGIESKIQWFDEMTFIEPGGRMSVLKPSSLPAPLQVMPSFLGFNFLNAQDKLALIGALGALLLHSPHDDGTSFYDWLRRHHQTHAAIERFWKPVLVSALSEDLDRISIPYATQVVRESMKSRQARVMGVPTVPLTQLYDAARDYIMARGGTVLLRSGIQSVEAYSAGPRIRFADSEEQFDYAALALPFDALGKILPDSRESEELKRKLLHFETSPITGVHFWFDRQITNLPHAVLLDRTIQWMFHKSLLLSTRNVGTRSADIPSYVELVISSSKSLINKPRQEIIDLALAELREFLPGAREAALTKATVVKELNATFSPAPGIDQYRPATITQWPNIFLAGDWIATGWPATMESAVRSGYLAAEAITAACGKRQSFLCPDVPPSGFMRLLA